MRQSSESTSHQSSCGRVEGQEFGHTIIHVIPVSHKEATNKFNSNFELRQKVTKCSAKITRAPALRRECTSLPSILPNRHPVPSHLRRSLCVSNQRFRCSSAQSHVTSLPTKADVQHKSSLPKLTLSESEESISVSMPQSTSISSLKEINQEAFTVVTRPPSRHGLAYEIVFKGPTVHCSITPSPQFGPDYTYSFQRANEEEDDNDWDSDGEFEDSDESEGGEEEETDPTAPPVPQCKYGVFFTAAKPPLPPSALERIRRYRSYNY